MSTFELLSLPFMQRALLAAVFTGLAAPAVGTYIVQRRLALMVSPSACSPGPRPPGRPWPSPSWARSSSR